MNHLEALTRINLDDVVASFGWQNSPTLQRALRRLAHAPARKFAELMFRFDQNIGECGLAEAARLMQQDYVRDIRLYSDPSHSVDDATALGHSSDSLGEHSLRSGQRLVPEGPFLALSNHPGAVDTLALFTALNRPDLKIIALDRPFLRSLPNMSRQLFFVQEDAAARMSLVRQVSSHLRAGGAALTFPAGHIEPDPDIYPGAVESLQSWTDSTGVFLRMAPETAVLPVLVRGTVWDKAARHPLLALKKTRQEKEILAASLQFLGQIGFTRKVLNVRVQIGKPIYVKNLGTTETVVIHKAVLAEMQRLIECPPDGEGISVL
ncbi:MAG: 1-acyl-sn-glycerol-3-phosphate acyltransferase [Chloroflexota bacterium]